MVNCCSYLHCGTADNLCTKLRLENFLSLILILSVDTDGIPAVTKDQSKLDYLHIV